MVNVNNNAASAGSVTPIVRALLVVARLGEVDHHGWWGTRSFGAAGRVVLKQRLPRTWRMAAIELDMLAATNRHNDIIDRSNAVHLFSDNWPVRRWVQAWVSEQKTTVPPDPFLERIEVASTDELVAELGDRATSSPSNGKAIKIGSLPSSGFSEPDDVVDRVLELASIYPTLSDSFAVPYYDIEG